MPAKRAFEEQIAALDALREQSQEVRLSGLRKALGAKNNFVVAKAADMIRDFTLKELSPELTTVFDRFFDNPEKSDPQCWAKNAISRALAAFEYQDADLFLRGMRHIQLEPVWGGRSDTAGTLRATCALALVQCRSLQEAQVLAHLVDLLGDSDKAVRTEVAHAIEQVGSDSASLLLRLRAVVAKDEPEVLGACYGGILRLEGLRAIPWVAQFLAAGDDAAGEAALAISATRSVQGFDALCSALENPRDPWFRSVLLSAIALTRQDAAITFLLNVVKEQSMDAEPAIEALLRSSPSHDLVQALQATVADNPRLAKLVRERSSDLGR